MALVEAAGGSYLPTLDVTLAYVAACGGDVEEWRERWARLHAALRAPETPEATEPAEPPETVAGYTPDYANPPTVQFPPIPDGIPGEVPDGALGEVPDPGRTASGAEEVLHPAELIGPVESGAVNPLHRDDPRRIGPFRLLGRLGDGVMGRVYLGASKARRPVAVRVITADLGEDPAFRGRFAAELSAARRVRNPRTPAVLDADPWADRPWVATAYVAGPTLAEAIGAEGPLPTRLVWGLAAAIAEALDVHHRVGVRHRALKPGNVLLNTEGPKVLDFGLARAVDVTRMATRGQWEAIAFLSPEQVEGRQTTSATDVFALGGLLAYAATGVLPFGDGSSGDLLRRIAGSAPYPEALAVEDPRLRGLIIACLDTDPFRRPTPQEIVNTCADHGPWANRLPPVIASRVARRDAEVSGLLAQASRQRTRARVKYGLAPVLVASAVALSAVIAAPGRTAHTASGAPGGAHRPTATATAAPLPMIGSPTSYPSPSVSASASAAAPGPTRSGSPSAAAPSSSGAVATTYGTTPGCQGVNCNGKDPFASGCAADGMVLYRLGTQDGVLEEWYSTGCQASWARIYDTSPGTWFYVQTCYGPYVQVFTVKTGFNAGYTFMVPGGGPSIRVGDLAGHGPC